MRPKKNLEKTTTLNSPCPKKTKQKAENRAPGAPAPEKNRDCEQFLHFYHAKIVTIDTRLLWHSISCINAFKVTKVHKGIAVNHIFQIAYTQEIVCS